MWNFFKSKKEGASNIVQFPSRATQPVLADVTQELTVGEQELVDMILKELRKGGAVIIELAPDDD
jgi:hypothetical protein